MELLESASSTLALQTCGKLHEEEPHHQSEERNDGPSVLANLCDIARFALDPRSGAKARTRTLALDCLRTGVELTDIGSEELADEVLAQSAMGARDERWGVRAAAALLAGKVLCGIRDDDRDSDDRMLNLLSSQNVRRKMESVP